MTAVGVNDDRSDSIGSQDPRSDPPQCRDNVNTRMSVEIAGANRDQRERRVDSLEKSVTAARGAAMVSNLQNICVKIAPRVIEQPLFLGRFRITNEQKARRPVLNEGNRTR